MKTQLPKSITIIGRRWFQKTYGNTYFSAVALVDGVEKCSIDYEYGYGDHYEDRMFEELEKTGTIPARKRTQWGGHECRPSLHCRNLGIAYTATATDVTRKRDL